MSLTLFALITLAVAVLAALYLWRVVPEGPSCPRCGAATRAERRSAGVRTRTWLDRWTVARACPVCGWEGRQRRGGEPEPIGRDGPPGRAP